MERNKYPIRAEDYELFEVIGEGVSASVHRSRCIPLDEIVAIKILDFERKNSDLSIISHEAQTMILIDHPNVLNAHCSFVNDRYLWVVMPYMAGGSCLHIMKSAYPDGFGEAVIATLLREVLKGLEYLHQHGYIHRDVKAGNILVDARDGVKLGDFGVSACLFDSGDRQRRRNTFVGTPCWMAPEVMEQVHGYDFKADIWSFGITALELAHGHAPFSSYPPMKVLLMTLQNAPPSLDYRRDKKFSRSFKHMIAMCLVKNPSKRPSAQKLLKQPFFKQARSHDYIARKILEGLPSLGDRFIALKIKEADLLAQKKMLDGEKEEISQNEYKRGISSWNFDIEDLKAQASLIPYNEDPLPGKDPDGCSNSSCKLDTLHESTPQGMQLATSCSLKDDVDVENDGMMQNKTSLFLSPDKTAKSHSVNQNDQLQNMEDFNEGKCLITCMPFEQMSRAFKLACMHINLILFFALRRLFLAYNVTSFVTYARCVIAASNVEDPDEKLKAPIVQQRGRFKVTSENIKSENTGREEELSREITDLQQRLACAQGELQRLKTKNARASI